MHGGLSQRYAAIWDLADTGASPDVIARATGQPIGQIELILGLRRQIDAESDQYPPCLTRMITGPCRTMPGGRSCLLRTRSAVLNVLVGVGLMIAVSGWLLRRRAEAGSSSDGAGTP